MANEKTDDRYIAQYRERVLDYTLWEEKANYLSESARLLEPKIKDDWKQLENGKIFNNQFSSIYFMLSSFAIENLLKAIIVKNDFEMIKNKLEEKSELPKCLRSHDLHILAKRANLKDLLEEEELLLKKLSENAIWKGRYSIPKGPEDYRQRSTFFTNSDYEWTEKLIKEVKLALGKNSQQHTVLDT